MLSAVIAFLIYFSIHIAPVIASVTITITYLPQIVKTMRTKDVSGISLPFWILLNIFLVCMVLNALGLYLMGASAIGYLVTELINWLFGLWQLILVIVFKKKVK